MSLTYVFTQQLLKTTKDQAGGGGLWLFQAIQAGDWLMSPRGGLVGIQRQRLNSFFAWLVGEGVSMV